MSNDIMCMHDTACNSSLGALMKYMFYESPVGRLTILLEGETIHSIVFGRHEADGGFNDDPVVGMRIFNELDEYFAGHLKDFTLKLEAEGTEFQMEVWRKLQEIPYGGTMSYSEVAESIGRPKAVRAVGTACRRNPIPILIPCHRVIGKGGAVTGYAGGVENKKKLLDLESTH